MQIPEQTQIPDKTQISDKTQAADKTQHVDEKDADDDEDVPIRNFKKPSALSLVYYRELRDHIHLVEATSELMELFLYPLLPKWEAVLWYLLGGGCFAPIETIRQLVPFATSTIPDDGLTEKCQVCVEVSILLQTTCGLLICQSCYNRCSKCVRCGEECKATMPLIPAMQSGMQPPRMQPPSGAGMQPPRMQPSSGPGMQAPGMQPPGMGSVLTKYTLPNAWIVNEKLLFLNSLTVRKFVIVATANVLDYCEKHLNTDIPKVRTKPDFESLEEAILLVNVQNIEGFVDETSPIYVLNWVKGNLPFKK
jgi:hypothetical protein